MHIISVDNDGSGVFENCMYAAIHYVITDIMTGFDESSKFNEGKCKYRRCGRLSCLGRAWQPACFLGFPFLVKIKATWLFA